MNWRLAIGITYGSTITTRRSGCREDADADEIRKAYRRLARKHHPDLNPGDKAAEDRFKKVQEAYDVLSEPKKKQMYDQYGFYSENGMPQGGAREERAAAARTWVRRVRFFGRVSRRRSGGRGAEHAADSANFQDIFSQLFGGGKAADASAAPPEKGADLEYGLSIDFWQAIKGTQVRSEYHAPGDLRDVQRVRARRPGANAVCPECNGSGNVTQMAGAMKFSLTCPRCDGTGRLRNTCPTCHGDGRIAKTETVEVRIPPGAQQGSRLRVAGKGNAGNAWSAVGRPVHHRSGGAASAFPARWRRYRDQGAGADRRSGAGHEDRSADHRRAGAVEDSAGHEERAEIPAARKRRAELAHRNAGRSDCRGRAGGSVVQDERTKELLREYATLHPEDPRAEMWTKV